MQSAILTRRIASIMWVQGVCSDPSQVAVFHCDQMDVFCWLQVKRKRTACSFSAALVCVCVICLTMLCACFLLLAFAALVFYSAQLILQRSFSGCCSSHCVTCNSASWLGSEWYWRTQHWQGHAFHRLHSWAASRGANQDSCVKLVAIGVRFCFVVRCCCFSVFILFPFEHRISDVVL